MPTNCRQEIHEHMHGQPVPVLTALKGCHVGVQASSACADGKHLRPELRTPSPQSKLDMQDQALQILMGEVRLQGSNLVWMQILFF